MFAYKSLSVQRGRSSPVPVASPWLRSLERAMAGEVHVTESPPTVLDADVRTSCPIIGAESAGAV